MRTLREWGIRVDQAFFCSDMSKGVELAALKPLIFFDDNPKNCADASVSTPTVRVLSPEDAMLVIAISSPLPAPDARPDKFLGVCKLFLKRTFDENEPILRQWQEDNLTSLTEEGFAKFTDELERSAKGTPVGRQRRAAAAKNDDVEKLLQFLQRLKSKHAGA